MMTESGIYLSLENPSALVLLGDAEQEHTLTLGEAPETIIQNRETLLGVVTETTYTGRTDDGFVFSCSYGLGKDFVTARASLTNSTDSAIRLRHFLLTDSKFTVAGDPADWWLSGMQSTPFRGNLSRKPVVMPGHLGIWKGFFDFPPEVFDEARDLRSFRDTATLYTAGGSNGVTMGAVGVEADVHFFFDVVAPGQVGFQARSEMTDVILRPGETRQSEEIVFLYSPYESAIGDLLQWITLTHGCRRVQSPAFGWCSWYDRYDRIDQDHVGSVIAAAKSCQSRLPMDVIQLDMGYEVQWGDWSSHPTKFPDGLTNIIRSIQEAGARPGIWFALMGVNRSLPLFSEHREWFQEATVGETLDADDDSVSYLDPTVPEARQFIGDLLTQAVGDGFTYFKCDYNMIRGRMRDGVSTRLQAFRLFYKLIRESIGDRSFLLACTGYERGMMGYADAARVAIDSVPVWHNPDSILCLTSVIPTICANAGANGTYGWNDPDVTYAGPRTDHRSGKGITLSEWQTWHGFVGLSGGMVTFSEPLHALADDEIRHLEILRPPVPEQGVCFGVAVGDLTQFGFVRKHDSGDFATVMFWNPFEEDNDVELHSRVYEQLTFPYVSGKKFHFWSFWDSEYLGIHDESFMVRLLSPHASKIIRITPVGDHVTVIGSNLHIGCGAAEIIAVTQEGAETHLTINNSGAREGAIYLFSQTPVSLMTTTGLQAELSESQPSVWKLSLHTRLGDVQKIVLLAAY